VISNQNKEFQLTVILYQNQNKSCAVARKPREAV